MGSSDVHWPPVDVAVEDVPSPRSVAAPADLASLPLTGLSIVDVTTDLAGHLCARLLADAGAAVTRFEQGSTDPDWATFVGAGLDPVRPTAEQEAALARAHVVLRTGSIPNLPPAAAGGDARPDRIVVDFPPFGEGPYALLLGGEAVLSALCGLTDCTPGYPDWQSGPIQPPVESSAHLAELGAAITCAMATMAALVERMRGLASPRSIEVSQFEAATALMIFDWGPAAYIGEAPGRRRNGRLLEPNMFIPCRDGYLVIVGTNDKQWQSLSDAMGSPAWASDPRFSTILGRAEHKDDLHRRIAEWALHNSGRSFAADAQARGVPCAYVLGLDEAINSEQVRSLGSMEDGAGPVLPADPIVRDGGHRRRYTPRPPADEPSWFGATGGGAVDQPLRGIRVLDCSQLIAGPLAGQYLASLGAEVLIIESRRHPTPRMYGPFIGVPEHDASSNFNHANRGKHSVELDLKTAEGKALFRQLVRKSDVVLENLSRRAADDLGITYDVLREERPDVILASISAFGRTGPWGGYTANHAGVAALGGLASATLGPRGEPHLAGGVMPDVLTGAYMALAILEALAGRLLTGRGAHVEVSMLEAIFNAMGGLVPAIGRGDAATLQRPAEFYQPIEGDAYVAVAMPHDPAQVGDMIQGLTAANAVATLQAAGLRAATVQDMLAVITDSHLVARGFVQRVEHPVVGIRSAPGVPWRYDGVRPPLGAAPVLGSDTQAVMTDLLHLPAEEVGDLRARGVLR